MRLEEFKECLKNPELGERFYRELTRRLNIHDKSTMDIIRYMLHDVIVGEKECDWCVLKTLYTRTKVKTSLNEFYYHSIPRLVAIGFLEMKIFISPSGEHMRIVRLSEPFISQILCPIMESLKNTRK